MSNDDYQHQDNENFCDKYKQRIRKPLPFDYPDLPGIKWVSKYIPDIIEVPVDLYNKSDISLGLEEVPKIEAVMYIDLSKLAGVRGFFPSNDDQASETECTIEVAGLETSVVNVPISSMMKAWLFYKKNTR
jgi:hypothetical protein